MKFKKITSFFLVLLVCACATQRVAEHSPQQSIRRATASEEQATPEPQTSASEETAAPNILILDERYFVIHYDKASRIARYVDYHLTAANLRKPSVGRHDHFHADALLTELHVDGAGPRDYSGSGYDRGHLAPSGDFTFSREANNATFTMANITPQTPGLNRQAWRGLEEQTRKWACGEEDVRVISGPIIEKDLAKLSDGVVIPHKFFKIIVRETPPIRAIGFEMSQEENSAKNYPNDVVPVKQIEADSGNQFFLKMSDEDRATVEAGSDIKDWASADCPHAGRANADD